LAASLVTRPAAARSGNSPKPRHPPAAARISSSKKTRHMSGLSFFYSPEGQSSRRG